MYKIQPGYRHTIRNGKDGFYSVCPNDEWFSPMCFVIINIALNRY